MTTVHDFTARAIDGRDRTLSAYAGKALLVVNVASRCGLTPHYAGLETLYQAKKAAGLEVLAFPCNQFGAQEPGTEAEIQAFCESRYHVSFPLFSKLEVNGPGAHPLYAHLTGLDTAPTGKGPITWNFEKFVVDRQGQVIARFAPRTAPDDPALLAAVERALG